MGNGDDRVFRRRCRGRYEGKGKKMLEFSRILTAIGLTAFGVGLVVFGIGMAFVEPRAFETTVGLVLMIGGLLGGLIGSLMYRNLVEE